MRLTLTHTEPLDFMSYEENLESGYIAPYYAVKLKDYPLLVFRSLEDDEYDNCLLLVNDDYAHCIDCSNCDQIEAWEPIFTGGYRIKRYGKK